MKIKEQKIYIYIYRSDQISIHTHIHTHHFNMQFYISPRQFIQNTMVCFVLFLYLLPSFVNFTTPHTHKHTNIFIFFLFLNWKKSACMWCINVHKTCSSLKQFGKTVCISKFLKRIERRKKRTKNFKSEPVELNVWVHVQAYQQRANSVYRALKRKKKLRNDTLYE